MTSVEYTFVAFLVTDKDQIPSALRLPITISQIGEIFEFPSFCRTITESAFSIISKDQNNQYSKQLLLNMDPKTLAADPAINGRIYSIIEPYSSWAGFIACNRICEITGKEPRVDWRLAKVIEMIESDQK